MASRTRRNIVYSFIRSAIDDAHKHFRSAYQYAFNLNDLDNAIERYLCAVSSIREAQEHMAVSSEVVSVRQKNKFSEELEALRRCQWNLTKEITKKARSCYIQLEKTSVLRMQFLAYSYEPQDDKKSSEADIARLHY